MILLHHLRIGRSLFTVWQLEEFGIDYEIKVYHRDPKTFLAPAELKAVHPLGKSPVIEDSDIMLSESGAITSYLLEKFDVENKFSPPRSQSQEWAKFTQWLHYPGRLRVLPTTGNHAATAVEGTPRHTDSLQRTRNKTAPGSHRRPIGG